MERGGITLSGPHPRVNFPSSVPSEDAKKAKTREWSDPTREPYGFSKTNRNKRVGEQGVGD